MRLFAKKDLITIKLNPNQIIALYTLPLTYDNKDVAETMLRYTSPVAYSIAFDDYIKFLNMETADPNRTAVPLTKLTFLSTDGALYEASTDVIPLINYLKKMRAETGTVGNFSTIHESVIKSLNVLYQNYLLNLTVLQAKLVEFLRWDNNKGNYAPVILPSLGVFEDLANMSDIKIQYEDDAVKDIEFKNVYNIPSNINVGKLSGDTIQDMMDNFYPDINLENYLYSGMHKYAIPFGYYIEEEPRREFEAKVSKLLAWEKKESDLTTLLNATLDANNKQNLPKDQFLMEALQSVSVCLANNTKPKPSEYKIYNCYTQLNEMKLSQDKPEPLTPEESELNTRLLELKAKPRWEDRYPKYTYYELIRKIEKKIYSVESAKKTGTTYTEMHPLEEDILYTDDWVMTLASLLNVTQELYYSSGKLYLLGLETSESFVDAQHVGLKLSNYHLTNMFE